MNVINIRNVADFQLRSEIFNQATFQFVMTNQNRFNLLAIHYCAVPCCELIYVWRLKVYNQTETTKQKKRKTRTSKQRNAHPTLLKWFQFCPFLSTIGNCHRSFRRWNYGCFWKWVSVFLFFKCISIFRFSIQKLSSLSSFSFFTKKPIRAN